MQKNSATLRQVSLDILNIVDDVPTLPDRFMKIQAILDDCDSTLDDLTEIIQTDQATSASILKIANSSFYNPLGAPVSNLKYAISRIGRQETGDIALSMSLLYGFAIPAGIGVIRGLWSHAFAVAQICRNIAVQHDNKMTSPDVIFMAALLHDIGRVILSMRIDMSYFEKSYAMLHGQPLIDAEQEAYGIDHAEVGKIVLKQWGLASEIYTVVADHHHIEPTTFDTQLCKFADDYAVEHLSASSSIEDVQVQLKEGLLTESFEAFHQKNTAGA